MYRTYGLKKGERLKHTPLKVDWNAVIMFLLGALFAYAVAMSI